MAGDPGKTLWRGIHGGTIDRPNVGAHVIDEKTGLRGQVEQVLDDGSVEVRLDDGTIAKGWPAGPSDRDQPPQS